VPAQAAPQEAPHREAVERPHIDATQERAQAEPRAAARAQQRPDSAAPQRPDTNARVEAPASGRDADMLRGRWNEVVERLSSISRVTWSMVGGNAQLGAVDGSHVILLFPVEAMVNAFSRGPRAADVEKAINEVTGLNVSVSAQVGQASGGPATTGPSAQASHPGVSQRPSQRPSQPGGWVSEPPPFDQAAAQAAPEPEPWPEAAPAPQAPVRAYEEHVAQAAPTPAPEPVDAGWPEPARAPETAPEPEPEDAGWPEPATVTPIRREPVASAPTSASQAPVPQPDPERPALPGRAARALAAASADAPEGAPASSPNGREAPRKHSFTVFRYPGDPEPGEESAPEPAQPAPATSPVFDDAPIAPAAHTPSTPTGWGDPVVIPGGASVNFDDGADSWNPPEPAAPADAASISAAPSAPALAPAWLAAAPEPTHAPDSAPGFGNSQPQRDGAQAPDAPLTGRAAAEAALREKAQREAAVASTRTHAADDDSASIDDENIENSQTIGLAAVLEILGGRVIEEKMTEGGY
jgi:DNA polymerase-3 subunit gamma/tau